MFYLPDLRRINVSGTDVTFTAMAKFSQLRPNGEVMFNRGVLRGSDLDLSVDGGQQGGLHRMNAEMSLAEVLGGLTKCRQFRSIDLSRTNATNADLGIILEGQTELERLVLSGTLIDDDGLKQLVGLTGLEYLGLSNTQVTDEGLEHLRGLSQLRFLLLGDTRVTADGAKTFQQAKPKCYVGWKPLAKDQSRSPQAAK